MEKIIREIINRGSKLLIEKGFIDQVIWQEFFYLIISYLSFNRKIDLNEIKSLSMKLAYSYNLAFKEYDRQLGTLLFTKTLTKGHKIIFSKLDPIIKEIKNLRERYHGKGNKSKIDQTTLIS